jgi:hypothetical protein
MILQPPNAGARLASVTLSLVSRAAATSHQVTPVNLAVSNHHLIFSYITREKIFLMIINTGDEMKKYILSYSK